MAKLVYIAGPLFSQAERAYLELIVDTLARASSLDPIADFFLPHRDAGEPGKGLRRKDIFELNLQHLTSSTLVLGLLDGQDADSGTCSELGYAYARGKKIFGLLTDFRARHFADIEPHRPNLMVWGVCEEGGTLFDDLNPLTGAFAEYVRTPGSKAD